MKNHTSNHTENAQQQRILLIEDDFAIRNSTEFALRREGFEVKALASGKDAIQTVRDFNPDLVLLDVMLPEKNGHEICTEIRQEDNHLAIIMISALGETSDRITGLRLGADDYVSKPFSLDELLMRVHANLRRRSHKDTGSSEEIARKAKTLEFTLYAEASSTTDDTSDSQSLPQHTLKIDPAKHEVSINGQVLPLRAKEFALLYTLASRPQEAFSRKELSETVWGQDHLQSSRTIDVHVRRLRSLLDEYSVAHYLRTIHGVGYRFEIEQGSSAKAGINASTETDK
jgi:DNA-binding response OmpR family regulator